MRRWCAFGMLYNGISHHSGPECLMCSLEDLRVFLSLGFGDVFFEGLVFYLV